LPLRGTAQTHLEIIRFAASNRLCVDLDYQGRTRRIEPYSLRRTQDGNIILHAWSVERNEHRSYRVDRFEGARTTNQTFTPRYAVELTPAGPVTIPPTTRTSSAVVTRSAIRSTRPARPRIPRRTSSSFGPTYVYECSYCGKKFRRKSQSSSLNPHKDKHGYPCPGRTGFWVDTQY